MIGGFHGYDPNTENSEYAFEYAADTSVSSGAVSHSADIDASSSLEVGYTEVYTQYRYYVRNVVRRIVWNDDAADVEQDIWLRVWRNWHTFRADAAVSSWLYRITLNASFDYLRRTKRKTWGYSEPLEIDGWYPSPEDQAPDVRVERIEQQQDLMLRIQNLPKHEREAMRVYVTGASIKRACKTLRVVDGTYKSRICRAKQRISAAVGN